MKTGLCNFSGFRIYPAKGIKFIRADAKIFTFVDRKAKSLFLNRKNPRKVAWTQAYRRLHKKGLTEEIIKKKTRKVQKVERAIVGASLEIIRQKRNQKPEMRAAARDAALKEAKAKEQAKVDARSAAKKAAAPSKPSAGKKAAAKPASKKAAAPAKGSGTKPAKGSGRKGSKKAEGGKRGSSTTGKAHKAVYKIDCSAPAAEEVFDKDVLEGFEDYLNKRIKIDGKIGQLGDKVKVSKDGNTIVVTTYVRFQKRYLKYLTKRYLKKRTLRDWLRVVATAKDTYQLRFFNIHDQEEEAEE